MLRRIPEESWPGIVLMLAAATAMILINSPLGGAHKALLYTPVSLAFGDAAITMPVANWVKNLLMALFFFYAGLELKRELLEGSLASPKKAIVPFAGAVGGMALPAAVYLLLTPASYAHGWAIPAATDIAFALGVLALLGSRVPVELKAFLLAVAVVDDLGAILIVAFVYTAEISTFWLGWAAAFFGAMIVLNRLRVNAIGIYLVLLVPLWIAMQNSGVNPTIAGVLAAACIPLKDADGGSPLHDVEHAIRPYVLFGVMPVFALATAGAELGGGLAAAVTHPVALGVAAGLAIGKPVGITILTLIAARVLRTPLPGRPVEIVGVGLIAGIGFTMSLFIGALAFADPALQTPVRMGVYMGSLAAAGVGLAILASVLPARAPTAATPETDPFRPFLAEEPEYEHDRSPRYVPPRAS